MSVVLSSKRKLAVKRVMTNKLYRKHHNGIKFTRVYFKKGKEPLKIDQNGNHINQSNV